MIHEPSKMISFRGSYSSPLVMMLSIVPSMVPPRPPVPRRVKVETRQPMQGRRHFKGELVAFERGEARLRTETGDFRIPFAKISRAQAFLPHESKGRAKR